MARIDNEDLGGLDGSPFTWIIVGGTVIGIVVVGLIVAIVVVAHGFHVGPK